MEPSATFAPGPHLQATRFGDHDELSSLIRGAQSEFIQRSPGAFKGEFTSVCLDNGTVQFGQVGLPYLCRGAPSGDRLMVILHLKPQTDYVWKGRILDPRSLIALPPHTEHQDITPANSYWALVSFDRAHLERTLASLSGVEPALNSQASRILLPKPGSFEVLRRRLKAVHAAVRSDPSFLKVPEARQSVEESVLSALALALGSASHVRPSGYGAATHARVTRQVEAYLSAASGESLYLADLCAVAGVRERTLRYIFQERYGMSPVQYLKLRLLHQVRRALRRADPDLNTVQSVANRCGIWHLGRFASEYKALFNEAPLETLKKACPLERAARLPAAPPAPRRGTPPVPGLD